MNQAEKRVTWDLAKNQANKKKHKISFEEAATVFYDLLSLTVDDPEHAALEKAISHNRRIGQGKADCSHLP